MSLCGRDPVVRRLPHVPAQAGCDRSLGEHLCEGSAPKMLKAKDSASDHPSQSLFAIAVAVTSEAQARVKKCRKARKWQKPVPERPRPIRHHRNDDRSATVVMSAFTAQGCVLQSFVRLFECSLMSAVYF